MSNPINNNSKSSLSEPFVNTKLYFRFWIIAGSSLLPLSAYKLGYVSFFSLGVNMATMPGENFGDWVPVLTVTLAGVFILNSVPSGLFFLWTRRCRHNSIFPKHSLCLWFFLSILYPWQIYFYLSKVIPRFELEMLQYLFRYPVIYAFEFLDAALLIGIGGSMIWRRLKFSAGEKLLIHWLLFVALIWGLRPLQIGPLGFFHYLDLPNFK